jgi:hypothetical protein
MIKIEIEEIIVGEIEKKVIIEIDIVVITTIVVKNIVRLSNS